MCNVIPPLLLFSSEKAILPLLLLICTRDGEGEERREERGLKCD